MMYPPIPNEVMGLLGPIRVVVLDGPPGDDEKCAGIWYAHRREIHIERTEHLANEWFTLYHELAHSILDDRCVYHIEEDAVEDICDAFALYHVMELQGRAGVGGSM